MKRGIEKVLPDGYKEAYTIDAKDKKTGLIMNGVAFGILALVLFAFFPLVFIGDRFSVTAGYTEMLVAILIFCVSMFVYIVLHELTHGAVYKLLTKEKLSFGISWSCAFCGVPNVYVYRYVAILALIAPLILFTFVFVPLCVAMYFVNPAYYLFSLILLGMHIGGCAGDIYGTYLFLFKFKDKTTLLRDTGPKQSFYILEEEK